MDENTDTSILGGVGQIIDGAVDAATSAGDAAVNAAYAVGDMAASNYYGAAAAGNAFLGDMAGATANNDEAVKQANEMNEDLSNVRDDLGF